MAKVKCTFWTDFAGNASFGDHKRGDVVELEEDVAISLQHRQIIVFGSHPYLAKEEKVKTSTKEEKHTIVTKGE